MATAAVPATVRALARAPHRTATDAAIQSVRSGDNPAGWPGSGSGSAKTRRRTGRKSRCTGRRARCAGSPRRHRWEAPPQRPGDQCQVRIMVVAAFRAPFATPATYGEVSTVVAPPEGAAVAPEAAWLRAASGVLRPKPGRDGAGVCGGWPCWMASSTLPSRPPGPGVRDGVVATAATPRVGSGGEPGARPALAPGAVGAGVADAASARAERGRKKSAYRWSSSR